MRKSIFSRINLAALAAFLLFAPVIGYAEVNVGVTIALPPLVIPAPPAMVVIPGSYVYYPPDLREDIFFYHNYWYRAYRGQWFRSRDYNGPWHNVAIERVPRAVVGIPPDFRRGPVVYERVPYADVRRNWKSWENERHWDRERYEKKEYHHEGEGRGERSEHEHEYERY